MADDKLTANEIASVLNDRAPDAKCSYCGHKTLFIVQDRPDNVMPYGMNVWNELAKAMPVYVVLCTNCGHLHTFSKVFLDSLHDHRKQK